EAAENCAFIAQCVLLATFSHPFDDDRLAGAAVGCEIDGTKSPLTEGFPDFVATRGDNATRLGIVRRDVVKARLLNLVLVLIQLLLSDLRLHEIPAHARHIFGRTGEVL